MEGLEIKLDKLGETLHELIVTVDGKVSINNGGYGRRALKDDSRHESGRRSHQDLWSIHPTRKGEYLLLLDLN